jgi:hypothetical protein
VGATKKRRNTKHRGNAAGMVETKGRTGGRNAAPLSSGRGAPREPKPANWNSAMLKGLIPLVILGAVLTLTKKGTSPTSVIFLLLIAYVVYVPIVYYTDRFMYNRYLKRGR